MRARYTPERVLVNYRTALRCIPNMTEEELRAALDTEASRPLEERRLDVINRLHSRYNKLRREREMEEYRREVEPCNSGLRDRSH